MSMICLKCGIPLKDDGEIRNKQCTLCSLGEEIQGKVEEVKDNYTKAAEHIISEFILDTLVHEAPQLYRWLRDELTERLERYIPRI